MIKLSKSNDCPEALCEDVVAGELNTVREIVRVHGRAKSTEFNSSVWLNDDVRKEIWKLQHYKCCYCERPRDLKREKDVDHYRPKAGVSDCPNHIGYWWLAYSWDNYVYSCKACNQAHKKNRFPLIDEMNRVFQEGPIDQESPLLINPFETDNDPAEYLIYHLETIEGGAFVFMLGNPTDVYERGKATIDICQLNRPQLLKERGRVLERFVGFLKDYENALGANNNILIERKKRSILNELHPELPFRGMKLYFLRQTIYHEILADVGEI